MLRRQGGIRCGFATQGDTSNPHAAQRDAISADIAAIFARFGVRRPKTGVAKR
jgi:hypothetical protein